MFEITGTVKKIFDEQTFGSGFNKREFVLTIESGKFPQDIKFECVKDKVALVAALKPGAKAKVFFRSARSRVEGELLRESQRLENRGGRRRPGCAGG
jgi:hypothetical protein